MSMAKHIREGERLAPYHYALDETSWRAMTTAAPGWFIAHWCDDNRAYALFLDQEKPLLVSTLLVEGRYFALSATLPSASWPERIAQDLWGTLPLGAAETEAALDRGGWASISPFSSRSVPSDHTPPSAFFMDGLQTDMPPLAWAARHIAPGGAHIGLLQHLHGKAPEEALRVVGRGVSSGFVATPLAYSRAIEQALGLIPSDSVRDARTSWQKLSGSRFIAVTLPDGAPDGVCASGHPCRSRRRSLRRALRSSRGLKTPDRYNHTRRDRFRRRCLRPCACNS
ncbi:hypothetical protein [Asaia astilbis]|uniref:hypothetical protein n=1 Tax=Asaia astilbis TaxID=610244 RepID=UPI000AF313C3|nr:hypothetical protein [Asaia astilbis]